MMDYWVSIFMAIGFGFSLGLLSASFVIWRIGKRFGVFK